MLTITRPVRLTTWLTTNLPFQAASSISRLRRLEPTAIEEAIEFLEADPWFQCSGYVKEEIVRRLKQAAFTERQRNRLASVIRRSITAGTRRVAKHLARLAPIVDSPSFHKGIESLANASNESRFRAKQIVAVLRSQKTA